MVAVKMSSLADNAGLTGTLNVPTSTGAVPVTGDTVRVSFLAEGPGVSTSCVPTSIKAPVASFGRSLWADFRLSKDLSLRAEVKRDDVWISSRDCNLGLGTFGTILNGVSSRKTFFSGTSSKPTLCLSHEAIGCNGVRARLCGRLPLRDTENSDSPILPDVDGRPPIGAVGGGVFSYGFVPSIGMLCEVRTFLDACLRTLEGLLPPMCVLGRFMLLPFPCIGRASYTACCQYLSKEPFFLPPPR